MRNVCTKFVIAVMLAVALGPVVYSAEMDSIALLIDRDASRTITINYRQTPFEKILDDLQRRRPGITLQLVGAPGEIQKLKQTPLTIGPFSGVSWDMALSYIADSVKLNIDKSQINDNIIKLELIERFSETYSGTEFAQAVMNIAQRGNANVIFSPKVQRDMPVYLSFRDVSWRDALDSVLKASGCTVLYDADGKIMRIATIMEADELHETRARPLRYLQAEGPHFQANVLKAARSPDDEQDFVERIMDLAAERVRLQNTDTGDKDVMTPGRSLIKALDQIGSENGKITYESRTNTLILRDTPLKIQEMLKIVDQIDVCPPQALIQARLLTIADNPTTKIGVRWGNYNDYGEYDGINVGADRGPSYNSFWPWGSADRWGHLGADMNILNGYKDILQNGDPTKPNIVPFGLITEQFPNYAGHISLTQLSAMLQLAKVDDRINITQAPELLVLDNEEATIYIGDVRKWLLVKKTKDKDNNTDYSWSERDLLVGVQLFVIPHIVPQSNQIMLEVIPKEVWDPVFTTIGENTENEITYPSQYKMKQIHTKMMLNSTETGVIAGLMRDQVRDTENKVPLLGDLPLIGFLFKNKQTFTIKENNLVFITPTILPPNDRPNFDSEVEAIKQSVASSYKPNDAHLYR